MELQFGTSKRGGGIKMASNKIEENFRGTRGGGGGGIDKNSYEYFTNMLLLVRVIFKVVL